MEKRESPVWTSSSPGITGHFLGRPTLVSHPRNHAGICGVWPLRMPLQQKKTGLGTVRAWILADWISAVLPDFGPWKMSLDILGASSAPTIHNPIYNWGYSSMVEHWENSITQEHMRSIQTGALPICMAPSGQRTLCAVLPHLLLEQGALPVLGLFCGRVHARRMMCWPNRSWTKPSAPPSRRTNQSIWETVYPIPQPCLLWCVSREPDLSASLQSNAGPHVAKELGVQVWFGFPVSGSRQPRSTFCSPDQVVKLIASPTSCWREYSVLLSSEAWPENPGKKRSCPNATLGQETKAANISTIPSQQHLHPSLRAWAMSSPQNRLDQYHYQFSCSVVSDSLWPHKLQHVRLPCPSPSPVVHPNSCPSSWWCHPTVPSSVIPFSSCPQYFPASGSFQMSQFFASGGQVLEFQFQHQSFQWILRTDFL